MIPHLIYGYEVMTLRDLSDPDDLQCSSSNLTYKTVLWAYMQKHVRKY